MSIPKRSLSNNDYEKTIVLLERQLDSKDQRINEIENNIIELKHENDHLKEKNVDYDKWLTFFVQNTTQ
jgi:hypothetical protein